MPDDVLQKLAALARCRSDRRISRRLSAGRPGAGRPRSPASPAAKATARNPTVATAGTGFLQERTTPYALSETGIVPETIKAPRTAARPQGRHRRPSLFHPGLKPGDTDAWIRLAIASRHRTRAVRPDDRNVRQSATAPAESRAEIRLQLASAIRNRKNIPCGRCGRTFLALPENGRCGTAARQRLDAPFRRKRSVGRRHVRNRHALPMDAAGREARANGGTARCEPSSDSTRRPPTVGARSR